MRLRPPANGQRIFGAEQAAPTAEKGFLRPEAARTASRSFIGYDALSDQTTR